MSFTGNKNQGRNSITRGGRHAMTRRNFVQALGGLGALSLVEPQALARVLMTQEGRLGRLANRAPSAEGQWTLTRIEGKLPRDLSGTLYRTAPGQNQYKGSPIRHLFDGDAFVSGFSFRGDGKVRLRARFVETPERAEEQRMGRLIYHEFGTLAPPPPPEWKGPPVTGKNQPSVNIIYWDNRLLGLSEGGHPTAIDPVTLAYQGRWDFHGTLPKNMSFTAHPKFDPASGEGYGYGIRKDQSFALTVYRLEPGGKVTELYSLPQKRLFVIHDMMLSKNYIIFVIPPVFADLRSLVSGKATFADVLRFAEKEPTRLVLLRRDGKGQPVTIEQPASFVFHHGNAFERGGKLVIDTILSPDATILEVLNSWSKDRMPTAPPTKLTRMVLDPAGGRVESRAETESDQEFPRFDERRTGEAARYLYSIEAAQGDPVAFTSLVRHDLFSGTSKRVRAEKGRALGEPVFVPHPGKEGEERGWLLIQGYDGKRDENFLEIRDAATTDFEARIWTGQHFPLGFHGNFAAASFVS